MTDDTPTRTELSRDDVIHVARLARLDPPVVQRVEVVSLFTTVRRRWREVDRFLLG